MNSSCGVNGELGLLGLILSVELVYGADRLIRYVHISIKAGIGPALAFSQDGTSTQIQAINISQNCVLAIQIQRRTYVYSPLRTLPTHPQRFHVSRSRRPSDRTAFSSRVVVDSCGSGVTILQGIHRSSRKSFRRTYVRRSSHRHKHSLFLSKCWFLQARR